MDTDNLLLVHLRNILSGMFHDVVVSHIGGNRYLNLSSDLLVFSHCFFVGHVLDSRLSLHWSLSDHVGLNRLLRRVGGGLLSVTLLVGVLLLSSSCVGCLLCVAWWDKADRSLWVHTSGDWWLVLVLPSRIIFT